MSSASAKILIIDDEPEICRFVQAGFSQDAQEVIDARNGREGIAFAATHNPDLILLDLGLPDVEGLEVLRRIRAWSKVPVVILSARGDDESKVRAFDLGADDYLTKPFSMEELRARIRAHLRRAARSNLPEEISVQLGDVEVNLAAHVIKRAGEEIHLTPKEFDLLSALVTNRSKVVPHRMLLTTVWGPAYADNHPYLRVFMANLRHKLERNPAEPRFLLTEPGVGYRLVCKESREY